MKPLRTFLFFALTGLLLSAIAIVIPPEGIEISREIQLNFFDLPRQSSGDTGISTPVPDEAEIRRAIAAAEQVDEDPESEPVVDLYRPEPLPRPPRVPRVKAANADSLKRSLQRIRFADGYEGMLEPFFRKLDGLRRGTHTRARILHFGDSQIENDRMTALLRYRLQSHFGGSGTGLVPAVPIYSGHLAYRQEQQGEWLRYTFFGQRDTSILHDSYGVMGAFSSVPEPAGNIWPSLRFRFNTGRRTGRAERVLIFLHSFVDSSAVAFRVNGEMTDTLCGFPAGFSVADYRHNRFMEDLEIYFQMPRGGRIYGISFESESGLHMDNIAMRGEAGLLFSRLDRNQQRAMMRQLDPDLILLQFGGNAVPYMHPPFYKKAFKRELAFFRKMCPGVPVIVIGPADMSTKERGRFTSHPNVIRVRDALREATLESGFAFWDLYEAMGGYNSMASFVEADPPLARTDYVHFTRRGVNLVGEMFYNALILEYNAHTTRTEEGESSGTHPNPPAP